MTDVVIDDLDDLIGEYIDKMRQYCVAGQEEGLALAFVDALTDTESRLSNARRLQRVRAVTAAAEMVRAERRRVV